LATGVVFIDLRKAFDTVDYALLIAKLKNTGPVISAPVISAPVINWFTSYLS
jgi:hypothetical protein